MSIQASFSFFLACSLLALLPGPDNLYVLAQSARNGWKTGFAIIFGLCTGLIVHTTIVGLGLSHLITQSIWLFRLISFIGATYLIYLAYLIYQAPVVGQTTHSEAKPLSYSQAYRRGVFMNLSNPKVIIFFLSFTQPFIQTEKNNIGWQYVQLGFLFILSTLLVFGAISVFAGFFGHFLKHSAKAQLLFNKIAASILILLAAILLFSDFL